MLNNPMIELNDLTEDGKLYFNRRLGLAESLLPCDFETSHACDLQELPGGDLLCVWFAGSDEGNPDVSIVMSRLNAGADAWTPAVRISDDNGFSEQNPSLFLHPNGELWVMYTAQRARTADEPPEFNLQYTSKIYRKVSRDNGYTWGRRRLCSRVKAHSAARKFRFSPAEDGSSRTGSVSMMIPATAAILRS